MPTEVGPALARRQLRELAEVAGDAVEVLHEGTNDAGKPEFTISLDTSGAGTAEGGVKVRERERFRVVIPDGFPFAHPLVYSDHFRWARTPHVQWGNYLCLYAASPIEWNPSDGMRGFISRMSKWVEAAASGTLDPDGQPLHPPAVYAKADAGRMIIHPDLGEIVPWAEDGSGERFGTLIAWCAVDQRHKRVDVLEWTDLEAACERAEDEGRAAFHDGRPLIAIPVTLTPDEFGFEYPSKVKELVEGLATSGFDPDAMLDDLAVTTHINRVLRARQVREDAVAAGSPWDEVHDEGAPLLSAMIVGTPSRRVSGERRLAHLAAWKLDAFSADVTDLLARIRDLQTSEKVEELNNDVRGLALRSLETSNVAWMHVMEARPEVTQRRDYSTAASWLEGKRVLVLGCGALGAPVAEHCVRAGVAALTVADYSVVNPGILVRQPYTHDDIGLGKARVLADRLTSIRDDLKVVPSQGDVGLTYLMPGIDLSIFDLIIDATANASVRARLELHRRTASVRLPTITMVIGHDAQRGLVTTNIADASGAGADTFRKVALLAAAKKLGWDDLGEDLFPHVPRTELFFPEPGCSAPTFIGSASETAALAGMMLNEALAALTDSENDEPNLSRSTSFAAAVRIGNAATIGTTRHSWPSDRVQADESGEFEVRIAPEALAEARAEVRRGARVREPAIETGGMLLGSFDDAIGVVYVDKVSGPPPDSYLSETYFQHGIEGTSERVHAEVERTASACGFVGFWHSHPYGPAQPSKTDRQGMASIVAPDGTTRRALMMILGGAAPTWERWRDLEEGALPDAFLRVVPRGEGPAEYEPGYVGGLDLQQLPEGSYYRGGFTGRVRVTRGGQHVGSPAESVRGHVETDA